MTTQQTTNNEPNTTKPQRDAAIDQALADARKAADGARAEQARLEQVAREAQLAADAAQAAFEANPTEKTSDAERIARQKSINARKAADSHRESMAPVLESEKRECDIKRLRELRLGADVNGITNAAANRILRLFVDFQAALATEIHTLTRDVEAFSSTRAQLNGLESTVGVGRQHSPFTMADAIGRVNALLTSRLGDSFKLHSRHHLPTDAAAFVSYANRANGNPDDICRARIAFIPGGDQGV